MLALHSDFQSESKKIVKLLKRMLIEPCKTGRLNSDHFSHLKEHEASKFVQHKISEFKRNSEVPEITEH